MKTPPILRRLALAAVALLTACTVATPASPPASPTSAAETKPASDADKAPSPSQIPTSLISEEDFKALHQLTAEKAPPARGQMIDIEGARAYLSLPKGASAPLPGVVVIHEWWGLNEHIKHWADRLAEEGYAAVAVDLYGGKVATNPDDAMAAMKGVDDQKARQSLLAAHRFLTTDPRVSAKRTGSIGWCFGGAWSLQLALSEPELDAAVIYYGRLVTDPAKLKAIRAPLLGIFADQDKGIPPATVQEFDKALHDAGVDHAIYHYNANHAFANPSSAVYDTKAAADAWEHVRAFLSARLKGG